MTWLVALLAMNTALAQGAIVDRIAAAVDDVAIPESEVRKAVAMSAMSPHPGETADAFRDRVLQALIDQHLSYADARRFGPAVPEPAEIDDALDKLRARLKKEGKDPAKEFAAAGLTTEEVRASIERQLVIQRYVQERLRPAAIADEDRAKEEYEKFYVPERQAAGRPAEPFESVADEMRRRVQQRAFDGEVDKWLRELRQKARITVYATPAAIPPGLTPMPLK